MKTSLETREMAVCIGHGCQGVPYGWGEQGPLACDCSGLIVHIMRCLYPESRFRAMFRGHYDVNSEWMAANCRKVKQGEQRYGTAVCFASSSGKVTHVGLVVSRDQRDEQTRRVYSRGLGYAWGEDPLVLEAGLGGSRDKMPGPEDYPVWRARQLAAGKCVTVRRLSEILKRSSGRTVAGFYDVLGGAE